MGRSCPNSGFIGFPLVAQLFGPVNAGIGLALAMLVENFLTIPLSLAIADAGQAAPGQGPQSERATTAGALVRIRSSVAFCTGVAGRDRLVASDSRMRSGGSPICCAV